MGAASWAVSAPRPSPGGQRGSCRAGLSGCAKRAVEAEPLIVAVQG